MFIICLLILTLRNVAKRCETLKYGTFGCKKFGFRAKSQRILKLCVASLLNILCFPVAWQEELKNPRFPPIDVQADSRGRQHPGRWMGKSQGGIFLPLSPSKQIPHSRFPRKQDSGFPKKEGFDFPRKQGRWQREGGRRAPEVGWHSLLYDKVS